VDELTPERLPCLIEYPRLLYYFLGLVLGPPAISRLSIQDHTTSSYHLVYHLG